MIMLFMLTRTDKSTTVKILQKKKSYAPCPPCLESCSYLRNEPTFILILKQAENTEIPMKPETKFNQIEMDK